MANNPTPTDSNQPKPEKKTADPAPEAPVEKKSYYGKRPLWQWVVIYVVVGGLVYGLIYYFVYARNGGGYQYNNSGGSNSTNSTNGTNYSNPY
jgi:hypothetical protein